MLSRKLVKEEWKEKRERVEEREREKETWRAPAAPASVINLDA